MQVIELAEKFLSIDSGPDVGNTFACDYLLELSKDLGLKADIEKYQIDGVDQCLIYIYKKNKNADNYIFWSNLQTNNPGIYSYWKETDCNPYKLTIKDNLLFGLGTSSGKLNFLIQILSLASLDPDKGTNISLVGGFGSLQEKEGATTFLKHNRPPKGLISSEPTSLKFCKDYSGSVILKMFFPFTKQEINNRKKFLEKEATSTQTKIFKAEPSFAFKRHDKDNLMLNVLDYLKTLKQDKMVLNIEIGESSFLSPSDGLIEIDTSLACESSFTSRFIDALEGIDKIFKDRFTRYVKKYDLADFPVYNIGFVRTLDGGIEMEGSFFLTHGIDKKRLKSWANLLKEIPLEVSIQNFNLAQRLPMGHDLEKKITNTKDAIIQNKLQHLQGDTPFFLARGIPAMGFGPGTLEGFNIINEYNSLTQVKEAQELYKNFMGEV